MTQLCKLVVVLPCHALEDFPAHHTGSAAESLLANWTALWHPSLIAGAARMPQWISSEFVSEDLSRALVLVPSVCADDVPPEVRDAVEHRHAILVAGKVHRDDILHSEPIRQRIDPLPDSGFVEDFFALGYAWLQVQLMTRQLRYSSSIDARVFSDLVVAAAGACIADESTEAIQSRLAACFDLLLEERNSYYPAEPKILDLVLMDPATTSGQLAKQLQCLHPVNLLLSGGVIRQIDREPEVGCMIESRLAARTLDIAGIQCQEVPLPLVSMESIVGQIDCGLKTARASFGTRASAFASFAFGLSTQLPGILDQFRFRMAFHATFSGGILPNANSPVMNWQGTCGSTLPALTVPPIDANQADGFLKLGITIGQSLDAHHHCTLIFAHWPNQVSPWYDSLLRIGRYGPLFGRPRTLSAYCDSIHDNGFSETFDADDYRFPYLETLVESGAGRPISRFSQYWRQLYRIRALRHLVTMLAATNPHGLDLTGISSRLTELQLEVDRIAVTGVGAVDIQTQINAFVDQRLPCSEIDSASTELDTALPETLINSAGFPRVYVFAAGSCSVLRLAGFEVANPARLQSLVVHGEPGVLSMDDDAELPVLKNEFFEMRIDPRTGGVRSVNRHQKPGNLLSQHLAIRITESFRRHGYPRTRSRYATAQVDEIHSAATSNIAGSIRTSGRLIDPGAADDPNESPDVFGSYQQITTVTRGSRRIDFDISVELKKPIHGLPWQNYLCSRMAWPDDGATLYRSDNEIRQLAANSRIVAPNFVEIRSEAAKLCLLPGGLPFHRRSDCRMLDTLLIVEGEEEIGFQFSIAIDDPLSLQAAIDRLSPFFTLEKFPANATGGGWIFHLSCKNVVVLHSEPVAPPAGDIAGCRMRLQETEGRAGELTLRFPATVRSAKRINLLGETIAELQFDGDRVFCKFAEYQFFQLEVGWRR